MNVHAAVDRKWSGLTRPNGAPIRLNNKDFVAIDRNRDASYEATYRPQALYNRANEGFHANNEAFLLHEVSTNLPIYRADTGPTDFHLHLPPGGYQLVLVTSGVFTFDYDGRFVGLRRTRDQVCRWSPPANVHHAQIRRARSTQHRDDYTIATRTP